jgi:hypothetical protein
MESGTKIKMTWEKVLEYATSPLHGTLSRKQRKGVKMRINGDAVYSDSVIFLGEEFIRITFTEGDESYNIYYDWNKIISISTISKIES